MKKYPTLAVVAACAFAVGCSYTERTTATIPAPAQMVVATPSQTTQQTDYKDAYTGKPLASTTVVTTR